MAALRPLDREALSDLQRNGGRGVIGDVAVSSAIVLGVAGLAKIGAGEPQPVVLTREGMAWRDYREGWAA